MSTAATGGPGTGRLGDDHIQGSHETYVKGDVSSIGALIGDVADDLSTLLRQEVALAKAEARESATRAGKGAGLLGGAGAAAFYAVLFLSIALWWALAHLVGHSWSALVVAIIWGVIGAVSFVMGKKKFEQVNPKPERTVETLQQVPGALKPH
jgi:hypothetical protein